MMFCTVVGARPNFIKMAPVILELRRRGLPQILVHTGQHYDDKMSAVFFEELGMPNPDELLGVGSTSHAQQTAHILAKFEAVCLKHRPQLVIVAGDVNSTLACALAAVKLNIPVAHVESGLRSGDRSMPEEINRILTDHMAEILFTTEPSANENLQREGIDARRVHFVGNTMIDSLRAHLNAALKRQPWRLFGCEPHHYGIVTFHRPSNVDDPAVARTLAAALGEIVPTLPLIFPIHPRTQAQSNGVWEAIPGVRTVEPLGYLDFLGLVAQANVVITDSGGIQEETTVLGIPCVTVRETTERPVTVIQGTNRLVRLETSEIVAACLNPVKSTRTIPLLWDGHAAPRLVDVLETFVDRQ